MQLNKIETNSEITNILSQEIPKELIKTRANGKNKLSYIAGATVEDILNRAFGNCGWSFYILERWVEPGYDYLNIYKEGNGDLNGKSGTLEKQGPTVNVRVRLVVHLVDENGIQRDVAKEAFGSKAINMKQVGQDSMFKAASTDALKKAASLFGIGLQLYRKEEDQQFFEELNYDNPWSDADKIKKAKEIQELTSLTEKYKIDSITLANFALTASDNASSDVIPDNIDNVIALIRKNYEPANNNVANNAPAFSIPNNINFPNGTK